MHLLTNFSITRHWLNITNKMIMLNVQQKVRQRKDKLQTCHPQLTSVLHYVGVNAAVGARPNPSDHSTVHHHYHHNCHSHFSCRQTGGTLFTYFLNSFFYNLVMVQFVSHSLSTPSKSHQEMWEVKRKKEIDSQPIAVVVPIPQPWPSQRRRYR